MQPVDIIRQNPPYVLVVGHGRSGTNWLLDILDASSVTHCRNEPNEVRDSALECVNSLWYSKQALDEVALFWDQRVSLAKISRSERDHHISTSKQHIHHLSQKTGLASFPVRPKIRKFLSLFLAELRKGEWPVPPWIVNRQSLEESCAVLKINMLAGWFINWHVVQYPHIPILHIVRNPKGYLNSSVRRFFSQCSASDLEKEREFYTMMLRTAVSIAPKWKDVLGDIDEMSLLEAVAWFWRLNNEMIYLGCKSYDNYRLIIYENIVAQPLEQARQIYEFCGLQWSEQVTNNILKMSRSPGKLNSRQKMLN